MNDRLERLIEENGALFHAGALNCAETTLRILCQYWEIEGDFQPRIATAFGGGVCGRQGMCGALCGALMAVGLRTGRARPGEDKLPAYRAGKELIDWFEAAHGTSCCRELTGMDTSTPAGQAAFRAPGGAHETVCERLAPEICRYLADKS